MELNPSRRCYFSVSWQWLAQIIALPPNNAIYNLRWDHETGEILVFVSGPNCPEIAENASPMRVTPRFSNKSVADGVFKVEMELCPSSP